ncbi:MAG TPA: putative lipid II flippase FtsW [Acholeplasmataceae bacterium]|nr:putative lipid II flippase FtsW [Acholeplasmataceae bacterium]
MHKRKIDYILLITVIILSLFGLLMVYSASNVVALHKYKDSFYFFKRQFGFWVIGMFIMFLLIKYDVRNYYKHISLVFFICILLLILVLIPGIGVVRGGARSWIGIGSFSIQPSEFMKLGLVGLLAKYLSNNYEDMQDAKSFFMVIGLIALIFLLIMLQPDFGTGLVLMVSCILLLFISGAPIKYFVIIGILGVAGGIVLIISAPYRIERITAFINPWQDPLGSGFQGIQALFAITPGGLFGHGFNQSMQKHFFLPEPQNDFIYAILLEEFGLIGGAFTLFLYFLIIYRGVQISLSVDNNFLKFLSLGISLSLAVQVVINIGVVVGLLPVTGITLPLFSYGGSSLVLTLASLGILISISKYQNYDFR